MSSIVNKILLFFFLIGSLVGCNRNQSIDLSTVKWIHGSPYCKENKDAPIQIVQYNSNTWFMRQNKCVNYEAPFMFLFMGSEKALLVDTGATEDSLSFPLRREIEKILKAQQEETGKQVNLIVAHSHSHSDHFAADNQFKSRANTHVVGLRLQEVLDFFKFDGWPEHSVDLELGNRKLTLIPIPGHDEMSIAMYDAQTKILLTGDSFYPGRLYVRDWPAFKSSINRLNEFCKTHTVDYILGNHIEMKDSLGIDYPTGTTYQPHEQSWTLSVNDLIFLNDELNNLTEAPARKVFDKFIVETVAPYREMSIEKESIHTISLEGYPDFLAVDGEDVWVTNKDYVQKLSATSNKPVRQAFVPGNCGAPVVAYGSLWIANCKDKSLVRVDLTNGKVITAIATGIADMDGELSLAAGAGSIWILSDAKGLLSRIDANTNQIIAKISVEPDSYCAAFGFESVWITNTKNNSVQRVDPTSNKIIATIPVGETPRFLTAGEGGVWTLNQKDGTVSMIDPQTNKGIATIHANVPGMGGDIDSGAGRVWVRAKFNRMLQSINPRTGKIMSVYGPLNGSGAVRVAGGKVWVTAHDVNKVWVIQ